ncbi:uncharacterized protein LOC134234616 [Saccostrea cucullata]|uniref:uncharacterized protein LOC134234616 n=1 Tax=Saccostrea cuccullata TaxID=36930 RepID=UPI002ED4044C
MESSGTTQIKKAIQHISETVFVGLCRKVGTSQVVAIKRDVVDIWQKVKIQVKSYDYIVMLSGSYREGFRLKESDIDYMCWPNNHRVIWDLSQSQYYNTQTQTLILCDCSDSPPGFTLVYLLSRSMDRGILEACIRVKNSYYISSSKYRQKICSLSSGKETEHGPCVSGTIETMEYDEAHCLACDFWPPSASSWIERCHSWPQPHIVDDIVNNGCHFVAIGHKL